MSFEQPVHRYGSHFPSPLGSCSWLAYILDTGHSSCSSHLNLCAHYDLADHSQFTALAIPVGHQRLASLQSQHRLEKTYLEHQGRNPAFMIPGSARRIHTLPAFPSSGPPRLAPLLHLQKAQHLAEESRGPFLGMILRLKYLHMSTICLQIPIYLYLQ